MFTACQTHRIDVAEPEPDREALDAMVASFREATDFEGAVDHFAFGDSPAMAEELGRLVLEGPKRATAGWAADEVVDAPSPGQVWAVLGGDGAPLCLIRTDELRILPFHEADPAFAWDEGEGDRTLEWWRDAHISFFTRRAEVVGEPFGDDSLVNFERFSVVWPELTPPPPVVEDGDLVVRAVRPDDRDWMRGVIGEGTSDDGWASDRCPGLLARHAGRTAGVLVFVPSPTRTEIVATATLTDVDAADEVEGALRWALSQLRSRYRWGPIES